ncbi:MAG: nuclear transport factor 2 family protein [Candidatus Sphingomonas colombiensis]|nr:nuclear transport factor 2 family protein [Sphingomonas sp.]WEK42230.1 MAG: nuclear transport factor 2 family protein [Sphingomonas sp.]
MIDNASTARRWLDILARGAVEEWAAVADSELAMQAPYMPAGRDGRTVGLEPNRERVGTFWKVWKYFEFFDIEAHAAVDDVDLVFVTASSKAETIWDAPYTNQYVMRLRFRNGRVADHLEFLNPAPVLEAFAGRLDGG